MALQIRTNSGAHWVIKVLWFAATAAFILYIPTKTQTGTVVDMTTGFQVALAAMALNLAMGYGGIISLGHSAFFGLGGYTTAVLVDHFGWTQGWTLFVVPVVGFIVGVAVSGPALRLQGIYLALVSLGLAVLFPTLMHWEKLAWLTNGTRGIRDLAWDEFPQLPFVGADSPRDGRAVWMYWLTMFAVVLAYLVCRGIVKSRIGRALLAIRDNETAAAVMGVDLARTKTMIFGISAAICAVGGALFGISTNLVNANSSMPMYTLVGSITFLVVMVLGGAGTLWGPIIGAVGYIWLSSFSRDWGAGSSDNAITDVLFGWMTGSPAALIVAVVLLVMLFVAPFGIVGLLRKLAAKVIVVTPAPAGTSTNVAPVTTSDNSTSGETQ